MTWLLYPKTEEMAVHEDITLKSCEADGRHVNVSIFFVDLTDIDISLKKLRSKIIKTSQSRWASKAYLK